MSKSWHPCSNCNGDGYIAEYHGGCYEGSSTCPICHGKGGWVEDSNNDVELTIDGNSDFSDNWKYR